MALFTRKLGRMSPDNTKVTLDKTVNHINYMQEALEQKYSVLEKRIREIEAKIGE